MDNINAVLIAIILGIGYRTILNIIYNAPDYFCVAIGSIIACLSLIYLTKKE